MKNKLRKSLKLPGILKNGSQTPNRFSIRNRISQSSFTAESLNLDQSLMDKSFYLPNQMTKRVQYAEDLENIEAYRISSNQSQKSLRQAIDHQDEILQCLGNVDDIEESSLINYQIDSSNKKPSSIDKTQNKISDKSDTKSTDDTQHQTVQIPKIFSKASPSMNDVDSPKRLSLLTDEERMSKSHPNSPNRGPSCQFGKSQGPDDISVSSRNSNYQHGVHECQLPLNSQSEYTSRPVTRSEYLKSFPNMYGDIRLFKRKHRKFLTKSFLKFNNLRLLSPSPYQCFCKRNKPKVAKKWLELTEFKRQPYQIAAYEEQKNYLEQLKALVNTGVSLRSKRISRISNQRSTDEQFITRGASLILQQPGQKDQIFFVNDKSLKFIGLPQ